jgi:hypothetical protein
MALNTKKVSIILTFLAALGGYLFGIYRNANESIHRSLQLKDQVVEADRVLILVTVTNVNPAAKQLTAQLGFRFVGNLAQDDVTPKFDLKLLVNNFGGQQEYDFPKGKRMHRTEVTFSMDGDVNKYPLDRHRSELRFLMTMPGKVSQPETPHVPQDMPEENAQAGELIVGGTALQGRVQVPLSLSLSASVPGMKFSGEVSRKDDSKLTTVNVKVRRPDNLIVVSFLVMLMMMSLALSVLAMALRGTIAGKKFDLLPLSLALSLIFGLPALRNIQPGVPPVGALADYFSFIWAEMFVAVSAIIIMWTWLIGSDPKVD